MLGSERNFRKGGLGVQSEGETFIKSDPATKKLSLINCCNTGRE